MIRSLPYVWNTETATMAPIDRFRGIARRQFVHGETYILEVHEQRSTASHRHYFAAIKEAHANLDEEHTNRYPTPEHLRKWALIKCGYHNERTYVCDSPRHAKSLAIAIEENTEFAVVIVKGNIVKIYTARSQAVGEMKNEEFKESKEKVLSLLAGLIGITRTALEEEGKRA